MGGVGHESGEGVGGGDGGDLSDVDDGDGVCEVSGGGALSESGHEGERRVGDTGCEARVAAGGEQVDLLAWGAGVGSADVEGSIGVGGDVGSGLVGGDAGEGGVEEGDAGATVTAGSSGEEIDMCSADGLAATVDLALDGLAGGDGSDVCRDGAASREKDGPGGEEGGGGKAGPDGGAHCLDLLCFWFWCGLAGCLASGGRLPLGVRTRRLRVGDFVEKGSSTIGGVGWMGEGEGKNMSELPSYFLPNLEYISSQQS